MLKAIKKFFGSLLFLVFCFSTLSSRSVQEADVLRLIEQNNQRQLLLIRDIATQLEQSIRLCMQENTQEGFARLENLTQNLQQRLGEVDQRTHLIDGKINNLDNVFFGLRGKMQQAQNNIILCGLTRGWSYKNILTIIAAVTSVLICRFILRTSVMTNLKSSVTAGIIVWGLVTLKQVWIRVLWVTDVISSTAKGIYKFAYVCSAPIRWCFA
jgi:hypothetical protein